MKTTTDNQTASAPETRKNDPNLNWAMYNPDKANPNTITAEKHTATYQDNRGHQFTIPAEKPTDAANTPHSVPATPYVIEACNNYDTLKRHADKLSEALREIVDLPPRFAINNAREIARNALAACVEVQP